MNATEAFDEARDFYSRACSVNMYQMEARIGSFDSECTEHVIMLSDKLSVDNVNPFEVQDYIQSLVDAGHTDIWMRLLASDI